ncbi:MAG: HAD family acid phosphatase [Ignavibacteriales bacterium]|nr:HAD family acid phosphatase [Ignavibacteriales bacterium]
MKSPRIYITILLTLLIIGCTSTNPTLQIMNLGAAKNAVQAYYESGEFDRECAKIIDNAIDQIDGINLSGKSAVVFDLDETALSNYEYTKEIGFGYVDKLWNEWQQKGIAPAIKDTKRFYDYLLSKNIHVIFVTGRYAEVGEATKRNLIEQGYAKFDTLIIRSDNERKIPTAEWKAAKREELVSKGYNIIACIGDQWSDLVGDSTGIKIKLPSYLYLLD